MKDELQEALELAQAEMGQAGGYAYMFGMLSAFTSKTTAKKILKVVTENHGKETV